MIDIETWGLDARESAFALGVAYDGERYYRFTSAEQMRQWVLQSSHRGMTIWGHNAGGFDYYILFGNLFTFFGVENVLMKGSKLIAAKYPIRERVEGKKKRNEYIHFNDSLNVLQAGVGVLGEAMGYPKGETPKKFIEADRTQGIEENDYLYCERDCKIVYDMLMHVYQTLGVLKCTIASTALDYFKRNYLAADVWIREEPDSRFKDAYFGGRVEAYRIGAIPQPTFYYDINSLYPYAMLGRFPDPNRLRVMDEGCAPDHLGNLMGSMEGCARVTVHHGSSVMGYLPVKIKGKLCFPTGDYTGVWTFPELRHAIERGIVTIKSVDWIAYSPGIESPFKAYIERVYKLKSEAKGATREVWKYILNCLYGKMGELRLEESFYGEHFDREKLGEYEEKNGPENVTWKPISSTRHDGYYIISRPFDKATTEHTVFSWASYVTSYARVINLQYQEKIQALGLEVYYTDTDSFTTSGALPDALVNPRLGMLKLEPKTILTIRGNKDYQGTEITKDGKVKEMRHTKGIKSNAVFNPVSGCWEQDQIAKIKTAIRRGIEVGSPLHISKSLTADYDKRMVHNDGTTSAIYISADDIPETIPAPSPTGQVPRV